MCAKEILKQAISQWGCGWASACSQKSPWSPVLLLPGNDRSPAPTQYPHCLPVAGSTQTMGTSHPGSKTECASMWELGMEGHSLHLASRRL